MSEKDGIGYRGGTWPIARGLGTKIIPSFPLSELQLLMDTGNFKFLYLDVNIAFGFPDTAR